MTDCLPCLCICGCPGQTHPHRYVCEFCAALWHGHDRAHAPPTAGECVRLRELQKEGSAFALALAVTFDG